MCGLQRTVCIGGMRTISLDLVYRIHEADEALIFATLDLPHHVHPKSIKAARLGSVLRQGSPSISSA